ncbi:phosphoribosylamine--glycine ligase [Candidatus Peregrinibacteria bacterium CG10_big_fil_rev_8_21_14_0_10_49_16]|nr:MAG: phosphoribosylamine--glycine ligase [Candidatus Peregrinibacteria bacterium CG10_big_fil_rev_8_21_14_0_10_49_16]
MRILLISSSARGHALADALARSPQKPDIIAISSTANPGIRVLACEQHVRNVMNLDAVCDVAKRVQPDFAFIGPDDPIGAGLTDRLEELGIPSVAPKKSLARIESSKGFTRNLLKKYGIDASPKFAVLPSLEGGGRGRGLKQEIRSYINDELHGEYVVKYDALKGGKGVKLSGEHLASIDEGVAYAMECIEECGRVVLEEKLIGEEFSLLSFVSGTWVVHMPAVQDHKRAYEGDTGPNTGGMGTYSDADHSLPFLTIQDLERAKEINELVAKAVMRECGMPYKGILYGGFIATRDGIRLIEYNARFGDPEALNILPLLESDFVDICQGIIHGELTEDMVRFAHKATVCKYIVPEGYPVNKDQKGEKVVFPTMCHSEPVRPAGGPVEVLHNAKIFFGDITEENGMFQLGGSRTAGIVGIGDSIEEAEKIAQEFCENVTGPVRFRSDIGKLRTLPVQ